MLPHVCIRSCQHVRIGSQHSCSRHDFTALQNGYLHAARYELLDKVNLTYADRSCLPLQAGDARLEPQVCLAALLGCAGSAALAGIVTQVCPSLQSWLSRQAMPGRSCTPGSKLQQLAAHWCLCRQAMPGRDCTTHLIAGKQCLAGQRSSPAASDCPCVSVQAGDARRELQEAQRAFAQQQGEAHAKLEAQAAELRTALEAARAAAQGSSQQQAWEELRKQTEREGRQLREQLQDLEAQVSQVTLLADQVCSAPSGRCCKAVKAAADPHRPGQ